jgi:hypothetical protein
MMIFPSRTTTSSMPMISTRLPVGSREGPLVGKRVALIDEAPHGVGDIRTCGQIPGEALADRAAALEGAIGHQLDGVLGVQIHDGIEIARVVPLNVTIQQTLVETHRLLPTLLDIARP